MDARAGAVTNAYVKGALPTDAIDLGTRAQLATNRRYSRNRVTATSRAVMSGLGQERTRKMVRNGVRNKIGREGSRALAKPLKKRWCGRRGSNPHSLAAEGF
jgi:hypothetical protein